MRKTIQIGNGSGRIGSVLLALIVAMAAISVGASTAAADTHSTYDQTTQTYYSPAEAAEWSTSVDYEITGVNDFDGADPVDVDVEFYYLSDDEEDPLAQDIRTVTVGPGETVQEQLDLEDGAPEGTDDIMVQTMVPDDDHDLIADVSVAMQFVEFAEDAAFSETTEVVEDDRKAYLDIFAAENFSDLGVETSGAVDGAAELQFTMEFSEEDSNESNVVRDGTFRLQEGEHGAITQPTDELVDGELENETGEVTVEVFPRVDQGDAFSYDSGTLQTSPAAGAVEEPEDFDPGDQMISDTIALGAGIIAVAVVLASFIARKD